MKRISGESIGSSLARLYGRAAVAVLFALALLAWTQTSGAGQDKKDSGKDTTTEKAPPFSALEKSIVDDAAKTSEVMKNLTYLSDVIGARLTGSAALKRANEWTANKMREYGLSEVHLEPWLLAEGWERGHAFARIIEPDNGRALAIASFGWTPGTEGKVTGEVVIFKAKKAEDLAQYKGKLKGAIVLVGEPAKLLPIAEVDKQGLMGAYMAKGKDKGKFEKFNFEEFMAFRKMVKEFLTNEGVAATFNDAGKHLGLLNMGGDAVSGDRPSARNKIPQLMVAHEHYALLYRLAQREGAKTRVELEVTNRFVPGPVAVNNTIGDIKGSEKPEEVVVVCGHLDSWDLGQGTLDNGTGSCAVLEAARLLAKCGMAPKRTIRFILFTGEEQGLLGSRAYCEKHKDELPRISACIAHDTGTGKVLGLGWQAKRAAIGDIITKEFAVLKNLGVEEPFGVSRFFGGSDHASFDRAGVPGCIFKQEVAGYGFAHHSQADTLELAQEAALIQGAQVMAIAAMRLANLENLLPRDLTEEKK